jgi:hypothetical protein
VLPEIAESYPRVMVCVDLVDSYAIKTPLKTNSLLELTVIDLEIQHEIV